MLEGGRWRGVRQVIGWHVHSLDGGDRPLGGGANPVLHTTDLPLQGGLVADGRRNTAEKRRHLGTSLGESENVVDEQQHILPSDIAEELCLSEAGKRDAHP